MAMDICLKYCGNCNPGYDPAVITDRLRADFPQASFLNIGAPGPFDFVLVICTCSRACADHQSLQGRAGKIIIVDEGEYERLKATLVDFANSADTLSRQNGEAQVDTLLFEAQDQVGVLTINRPSALNALNDQLITALAGQLDELAGSDLRCLIVTGAGEKAFIAGADIGEMKDMLEAEAEELCRKGNEVMDRLERLPMPVIAAINGFALGGGFELALSCDIRLASDNAVFALPEVGLGVIPGYGGMQRLIRIIGLGLAKELVYTGRRVKAEEARTIGLVNAVCPQVELMNAARTLAGQIAANAPLAVRAAKAVINESLGRPLTESYCLEMKALAKCFASKDKLQAMTAFLEKKKPAPFSGS